MRCHRKPMKHVSKIVTCVLFAFALYMVILLEPRYIPISILRIFLTPTRLRKSSCPSDVVESRHLDHSVRDVKTSYPRYVFHQHIGGRIGNRMFQTAATVGIAHSLHYKPYIDVTNPLTVYFEIAPTQKIKLTNMLTLSEDDCRHEVWKCRREIYSHNLTIKGWLQSWKYFEEISPQIRKLFTFKPFYRSKARSFIDSINPKNRTLIGLHVRRTDTRTFHDMVGGYTGAEITYINKAMNLYRKEFSNAMFLVVSDDKTWCKENIMANDIVLSGFEDPILDLTLLSMCDHMIMTIGTFGWWGAWLAGGKVVYLKDWPRPDSWLDLYGVVKEDFFKPEWIGLSN